MNKSLYTIKAEHQEILNELEILADDEITPEQIEALNNRLTINDGEFLDKAESYGIVISDKKSRAAYLKKEAQRLQAMARVELNQAERLENALSDAMDRFGYDKEETDHFKFGWTKSEAVEHDGNFKGIPKEFVKVEKSLDKKAVKSALKAGQEIPGCKIVKRKNLRIR